MVSRADFAETHITGGQHRPLTSSSSDLFRLHTQVAGQPQRLMSNREVLGGFAVGDQVTIVGLTSADSMPYNNTVARIEAWLPDIERLQLRCAGNRKLACRLQNVRRMDLMDASPLQVPAAPSALDDLNVLLSFFTTEFVRALNDSNNIIYWSQHFSSISFERVIG